MNIQCRYSVRFLSSPDISSKNDSTSICDWWDGKTDIYSATSRLLLLNLLFYEVRSFVLLVGTFPVILVDSASKRLTLRLSAFI